MVHNILTKVAGEDYVAETLFVWLLMRRVGPSCVPPLLFP